MVSVFSLLVGLEAILRIDTVLTGLRTNLPWCSEVIMGTASTRYQDGAKKFESDERIRWNPIGSSSANSDHTLFQECSGEQLVTTSTLMGGCRGIFNATLDRRREVIEEDGESKVVK